MKKNFRSIFKLGGSYKGLFLVSLFVLLLSSSLYVCVPSVNAQSTVYVGNETTLRDAVTNAVEPTVIVLTADIQLTSTPLNIASGKNITLTSNSPDVSFRLIGASGQDTISVASGGRLELAGITVTHESGANGRGVYVYSGGTLTLTGGTISGNTITGTTSAYGGGIYNSGTIEISGTSTITNNTAQTTQATGTAYVYGGGIYNTGGNISMSSGTIANNTVVAATSGARNGYGGGIANSGSGSSVTVSGGIIANNTTIDRGGGIYNSGTLEISGAATINNSAQGNGGGIFNQGTFTLLDGPIVNNTASHGGGIYNWPGGSFTMLGGLIVNNTANGYDGGGGICIWDSSFTMFGGTIANNTAADRGGGIAGRGGSFTMLGGLIVNNTANQGGGISIWGSSFTMFGGTIANNTARYNGGGVNSVYSGALMISGGTITNNTAMYGGGIYNDGNVTVSGGIIAGNTATNGGGIYLLGGFVELFSGLVVDNSAVVDGGGVWVARANLNRLFVYDDMVFSNNRASVAYNRNPADDATYYNQIGPNVTWTNPFTQGYNNYDISYTYGTPFIFSYNVTVNNSYATVTGAGTYQAGQTVTINAGTRPGYTFTNWTINEGGIVLPNTPTATFTMPENAVTVTANWALNTYNITYILNGGINNPTNPNTYTIEGLPLTIANPTKPNYNFTGWTATYTNGQPNTTQPTLNYIIPPNTTGDIILTAHWSETPNPGTITITKQTNPIGSQTVFEFTLTDLNTTTAFSLSDGQSWSGNELPPATYTLTELPKTGWNLTNIIVVGTSNYTIDLSSRTLTFVLESEQHLNLTFVNTQRIEPEMGRFSVTKLTNPPDTAEDFAFLTSTGASFSLTEGGDSWYSGEIPVGVYTVTELSKPGWELVNVQVDGTTNYTLNLNTNTLTFTLEAAQIIALYFVNTERIGPEPGFISVTKLASPPNSETLFSFVTSAPPGSFSLTDGTTWQSGPLTPGSYTLTELAQPDWDLTSIIINDPTNNSYVDLTTRTVFITLDPGETITILYQNTKQTPPSGTINVVKTTCPTDTSDVFNFVTSMPPGTFSLTNADTWQSGPLTPGSYTLTELAQPGWDLTNIIINDPTNNSRVDLASRTAFIVLDPGETMTVFYQNTQQAPDYGSFSVAKVSCPGDSSESFRFVTSAPAGSFNLTDGQSWSSGNLSPGIYTVTELVPQGWELTNILLNDPSGISTVDLATGTATINLQAGTHISIVYQDAQLSPQGGFISVVKVACPTDTCIEFSFVSSASEGSFSLGNGEVWTSSELSPGRYLITETMQPGWALANIVIADPSGTSTFDLTTGTATINLQANTHITIIYQNTEQTHPDCYDCENKPCQCKSCNDCYQKPCQCKPCSDCYQKPCQCKPCCDCSQKEHRYEVFDISLTYHEAKAFCEKLGGHIATITSQQESNYIYLQSA